MQHHMEFICTVIMCKYTTETKVIKISIKEETTEKLTVYM